MESLALMASLIILTACACSVVLGILLAMLTKKNVVVAAVGMAVMLVIPWWLLPKGICPLINLLSLCSFGITRFIV